MAISKSIREYGGVIWTDHALERINKRRVSQNDVVAVLRHPDRTFPGKKKDTVKFIRDIEDRRYHVVASLNEYKKWVVVSVWVKGEEDQWGFPEKYVYQFVGWVAKMINKSLKKVFNV